MRCLQLLLAFSWASLWLTPDQQGQRLVKYEQYADAAQVFEDPMRQGVAWYRAGEFKQAAEAFARVQTAEGHFNLGNAWTMLGKYDKAIASYDDALQQRPEWHEATENRELAAARAKLVDTSGGDFGDQRIGADEIVFDQNKPPGGQETEIAGDQPMTDATVQATWLRNVQTKPADFLKAKFAYQKAQADAGAQQ
jgi:Ca-activated chloride channel family protein